MIQRARDVETLDARGPGNNWEVCVGREGYRVVLANIFGDVVGEYQALTADAARHAAAEAIRKGEV